MSANTKGRASWKPVAFREETAKRRLLEAISDRKGHADLSVTLREATAEYIEKNRDLLLPKAA
jgi:hypothetical protein